MMRIRTILGLIGLMFASIHCQSTCTSPYQETHCLYKKDKCIQDVSTPIDVSSVPYQGNIAVKLRYGFWPYPTTNCSLVLIYNTPALFLVKQSEEYNFNLGDRQCLTLFDGPTTGASKWLRKCGRSDNRFVFITTGPAVVFHMTTPGENIVSTYTFIVTPGALEANLYMEDYCQAASNPLVYPNKTIWLHTNRGSLYNNSVDCTMTLYTEPNHRLLIKFHALFLEEYDCLTFYDSDGTNTGSRIRRVCGIYQDAEMETKGRYLTINFNTDAADRKEGATMAITSTSEEWTCDSGQVKCDDGSNCYSLVYDRCDGNFDCNDGSDEKNCSVCYSGVKCEVVEGKGQVCIPRLKMCDGMSDCLDNQDELHESCWCLANTLRCLTASGYKYCIGSYQICDSDRDCLKGEDEEPSLCDCQSGFYCHRIPNGQYGCLNSSDICNGERQCMNGYDEDRHFCECSEGVRCRTDFGYECLHSYDLCDSYSYCLDGQDESSSICEPAILSYWSSGGLAGIFIGYIIFAVIVVVITCMIPKKCKPLDE
ncbi:uncharacterized protein LOC110987602 isoform X2 [Acanthaster planci]|uniref:Uncharacterized protein LOC110987602 isoform X2 n=1 Tax=Acanthaster planci TaxID=133434 RepID=A0A8B7ZRT7_ACAPL|nr:uncharacterized protein LOC110987602 isoform X2 [Acanthaster planci]